MCLKTKSCGHQVRSGPFSGFRKRFLNSPFSVFNFTAFSVTVFLLSALLLSGCTPEDRRPGYVYYSLAADPFTLDPALVTDVPGGTIAAKLFNGLLRIGPGLRIQPDIAKSWQVSKDGLLYSFRLRQGVKFSNGREVRAEDFKYSFERVLNPKTLSPNTWVLSRIQGADDFMKGRASGVKGIEVKGPFELEIKLDKPFSPFPYLLAMTAAYVVPREAAEAEGLDFSSKPCGTGPFTIQRWTPNEELVLKARGDYFEGTARVKGIVYRVIPEELTQVVEFELGNLDVISIPAPDYSRFRKDPKWSRYISMQDGIDTYYLGLNCSRPPFNDRRLRRALNYAIDRKKILETFMENRGTLSNGPVPPALRHWASPSSYEYNPERARRIIRQEGFAGVKVRFYITSGQQDVTDMAEIIQAYLAKVGIRAELKQLEWNTYKEAINQGEPDMFWLSWWADYPDPENFLYPLFDSANMGAAGNRTRYSNPKADKLIEHGQHAASAALRDDYYRKAEDLIVSDAPWVFFWHTKSITVRQPWIKNYVQYPVYSMDKGMDIRIER